MAENFPYRIPQSIFELFDRPIDPYKANYDKVFFEYLPWNEELGTWELPKNRDIPTETKREKHGN